MRSRTPVGVAGVSPKMEAPYADAAFELPTIFVSIANYRDSETPHTVADLLRQAAHPDRIRVGVWSQVVPGVDDDCLAPDLPQVRQVCVNAQTSRGACWARSCILTQLRGNETYVLQIDSHSRFEPGWDERFIHMLALCPSPRPVLGAYPVAYTPPRELGRKVMVQMGIKAFNRAGVPTLAPRTLSYAKRPAQPAPAAFVGANCLFARAEAFDEVPYDPYLYFYGEEVSLSVRLWTHGWDLFAPNDVLMYHDYTQRARPRHWTDHEDWTAFDRLSFARYRYLMAGVPPRDPEALVDIERYGMGQKRSVAAFCQMAQVNLVQPCLTGRRRWVLRPGPSADTDGLP